MEEGFVIKTKPLNVFEQMAADEYFCQAMPRRYLLRFFNWSKQGITFGFSQKRSEIQSMLSNEDLLIDITRRPTGGGLVFHKTDLTFSFIFYNPGEFNPYSVYEKLHTAASESFAKEEIKLEISTSKTTNYKVSGPPMNCFSKPVEKDLMISGRKVLGGALRKFSDYMLYQASFQIPDARERSKFYSLLFARAFSKAYEIDWKAYETREYDMEKIREIAYNKYCKREWIERI